MTKLLCTSCGTLYRAPFKPERSDYQCDCGGRRVLPSQAKPRKAMRRVSEKRANSGEPSPRRTSSLKRTRRRETAAEKRARQHFNDTVKGWPCWFRWHRECEACGGSGRIGEVRVEDICPACHGEGTHTCSGPKDAHHLVEKQWIRRNYADLPEDKLLAILFCPQIGAPLCRYNAHERIKSRRIHWHELTLECIEFCSEVDHLYLPWLTPAGTRRQPMLSRLELECPHSQSPTPEEVVG